jgi:hypothetical protein
MPYCRRCGTQLEENARFCHKCGTPVAVDATYASPPSPPQSAYRPAAPMKPWHKDTLVVATIVLVTILLVAVVAVALLTAPLGSWSLSESLEDKTEGVKTVNLNFHTNVGQIIIFTQKMGNNNICIYVQANGSRGLFGNRDNPVSITFDNQTVGDVLTVNSSVHVEDVATSRSRVQIMIYVDPDLTLDFNVSSTTGQVSFTGNQDAVIQNLNLHAVTGEVQANLETGVIVTGNVSLSTTTGAVNYRMSQTFVFGNCTVNLHSVTGEVNMDITQTKTLDGNLWVNSETTTGSINLGLTIDDGVGAKIASDTGGFGNVHTDLNNFNGENELVQSANYPSASNIEIDNKIHAFGSVYIQASYLTVTIAS